VKPDPRFSGKDLEFWSYVRLCSQHLGYTEKKQPKNKIATQSRENNPKNASGVAAHTLPQLRAALEQLGFLSTKLQDPSGTISNFGRDLEAYFSYRAELLNQTVRSQLMDRSQAETEFLKLKSRLDPHCPLPTNKQKGEKRNYAFLTGIVNMLLEQHLGSDLVDYDPRRLITVSRDGLPLRTFSRRLDGCFLAPTNPKAIWEIKEYYYTTTFGSRVADGVYETMLDGLERSELEKNHDIRIHHTLFIDDRFTWWDCGKSYLCRLVDLLNMGYVSELIVGREVLTRLPELIEEWKRL
jgi:hypothetical protein